MITTFSCCKTTHEHQFSVTDFRSLNTDSLVIIDVRTPEEYIAGHINNAVNIDWYDPDFFSLMERFDPDSEIYIYCETDVRSNEAAVELNKKGFKKVYNLAGGYREYSKSR